jgi:hypothetical protein
VQLRQLDLFGPIRARVLMKYFRRDDVDEFKQGPTEHGLWNELPKCVVVSKEIKLAGCRSVRCAPKCEGKTPRQTSFIRDALRFSDPPLSSETTLAEPTRSNQRLLPLSLLARLPIQRDEWNTW